MTEALRPLLFADKDQKAKATRAPVAPANRSENALENRAWGPGYRVGVRRAILTTTHLAPFSQQIFMVP